MAYLDGANVNINCTQAARLQNGPHRAASVDRLLHAMEDPVGGSLDCQQGRWLAGLAVGTSHWPTEHMP